MSTTVYISAKIGRLPLGYEFAPAGYRPLLLQRLELYITDNQLLLGTSDRPHYAPPPWNVGAWFKPRSAFTDGVANSSTTYTSVTAIFEARDVGLTISGTNIPANTTIVSVTNATTAILSAAATATASGLSFEVGRGNSWWAWNENLAEYEPIEIGLVSGNFGTTINAAPTANRTLTLPNATGTALLLTDVSVPKETVILTSTGGAVSTIDADVSNNFILTLTENSTIPSLTNMTSGSGKKIRIAIINDGTSFTVTWPTVGANEIKWPASPSHTQPVASAGQPRALAVYTITEANIGQTYHLWGDPEVAGFNQVDEIDTGGPEHIDPTYGGEEIPAPKGIRPYDRP